MCASIGKIHDAMMRKCAFLANPYVWQPGQSSSRPPAGRPTIHEIATGGVHEGAHFDRYGQPYPGNAPAPSTSAPTAAEGKGWQPWTVGVMPVQRHEQPVSQDFGWLRNLFPTQITTMQPQQPYPDNGSNRSPYLDKEFLRRAVLA